MKIIEKTKFEMKFQSFLGLCPSPSSLKVDGCVRWKISSIEIIEEDKEKKYFRLIAEIDPVDINENTPKQELKLFRNSIISLLSFLALCPIEWLSKGVFTFHLGEDKYRQMSLGHMKTEYSLTPVNNYETIINGMNLEPDYLIALHFIERAIGSEEVLYEFINLAICIELTTGKDSKESTTINPKCNNGHNLKKCPECNCDLLIPNTLRNRSCFLMDNSLARDFSEARNKVFHGRISQIDNKFLDELKDLNIRLLICLRNYFGEKIGLNSVDDLPFAIKNKGNFNPIVSVYFTNKKAD